MGRLQKRVVMISVAVAALVILAAVLGSVAERANSKSFVGYDGSRYCVYRRTAALGCGIAAAMLLLAGQAVLGAASGCFGRCGEARARPISDRKRRIVNSLYGIYWTLAAATTFMFLYGAWRNAGGTSRPTRGRYHSMRGCRRGLDHGVFSSAAGTSVCAFFVGIMAYVYQETADPEEPQGVAMGQQPHFQPEQAYQQAYPAMGYPAAGPPPPYGGYGAKAHAGMA